MLPLPIYSTRLGKLYNQDCLKVLKELHDNSLDCIFADPPFNLGKKYNTKINDNKTDSEYLSWTTKWIDECVRILKPGGSLFIYNIPKWNIHIANHLQQTLNFRHWIAIDFKASMPIPHKLYPAHYSLIYFTKSTPHRFRKLKIPIQTCPHCHQSIKDYGGYKKYIIKNGGINLSDVWSDISPVRHKGRKNGKNNELPEIILERILKMTTDKGYTVFDPFGGTGTTYAVAERLGRRWLGCEIGACNDIIKRLKRQHHATTN